MISQEPKSVPNSQGTTMWSALLYSISVSNCIIELPHTEGHTRIHERRHLERFTAMDVQIPTEIH